MVIDRCLPKLVAVLSGGLGFSTDLEEMIKAPLIFWGYGHTVRFSLFSLLLSLSFFLRRSMLRRAAQEPPDGDQWGHGGLQPEGLLHDASRKGRLLPRVCGHHRPYAPPGRCHNHTK